MLWELYTLEFPYDALSDGQVLTLVKGGGRPALPDAKEMPGSPVFHSIVRELLARCWEQDPARRLTSIELLQRLEDLAKLLVSERRQAIPHNTRSNRASKEVENC